MTITVNPVAVAASIANLTISGVTLKDIDEIPDSGAMQCPVILPQPNDFITTIQNTRVSFGSMGNEAENFEYNLNYVFLYTDSGSGQGAFADYSGLITKLTLIINTILNNDVVSGLVDMELESISGIGQIEDPSGNPYWGAFFTLKCLEYGK